MKKQEKKEALNPKIGYKRIIFNLLLILLIIVSAVSFIDNFENSEPIIKINEFSSNNRSLTQKHELHDNEVLFGQLMHDTYVPGGAHSEDDPLARHVLIKLDDHLDSIDSIKIPPSMCKVGGVAYNRSPRADILEIALQELICDVNGVVENHKIDVKLIEIKAKSIPAAVVMKNELRAMNKDLHDSDKRTAKIAKYYIKDIEDAPPFLFLSANTLIHSSHFLKTR